MTAINNLDIAGFSVVGTGTGVPIAVPSPMGYEQDSYDFQEPDNILTFPGANGNSRSTGDDMRKAVGEMNKNLLMQNSEAIFGIHESTNRITIKIVDKESKKVIKEIPPEKTLDMLAKMWEMAGILVDEKR